MGVLSLIGGVVAAWIGSGLLFGSGQVLHWLVADDWAHLGFVLVTALFSLALAGLYRVEKEVDDLELDGVRVEIHPFCARALPTFAFSQQQIVPDVLEIRFRIIFQNNSASFVHPWVSGIELQHRHRTWKPLPYVLGDTGAALYNAGPIAVPPKKIEYVTFTIHGSLPGGASSYLHQRLRLKIEFSIPGQRPQLKRIPFSPVPPTEGGALD